MTATPRSLTHAARGPRSARGPEGRTRWSGALPLLAALTLSACSALPPATLVPVSLEGRVSTFGDEVAQLRELPTRREVPAGVQSEAELRQALQELVIEDWDADEEALELGYKLFGLIPPLMDLRQYLVELYTGQIAGYYDPKSARFFIKADEDPDELASESDAANAATERQFVIAHEYTHALQDQSFDLRGIDERYTREADRLLAIQALIEGDAMLAGIDHLIWRIGLPVTPVSPVGRRVTGAFGTATAAGVDASDDPTLEQLRDAPDVIATNLMFPYIAGMAFASAIRREFGQAGVDQAFRDPPDSTEQILYPERYLDRRDLPAEIELVAPSPGFAASLDQTLGMLDLQVLLRSYGESPRGAEGWDGDRFTVWTATGQESRLAWVTAWDRPGQARRFARSYARVLERKRGDDRYAIRRRGSVVAVLEGADAEVASLEAERLLESPVRIDPDDRPPLGVVARALRWPLSFARLDRVFETTALGGNALRVRIHEQGQTVQIARGFGLRIERTPDRRTYSAGFGLVWSSYDRLHQYWAAGVPIAFLLHTRGAEETRRFELTVGQTVVLPSLLWVRTEPDATRTSLLGLIRTAFGPGVPKGERISLLFGWVPIPFL